MVVIGSCKLKSLLYACSSKSLPVDRRLLGCLWPRVHAQGVKSFFLSLPCTHAQGIKRLNLSVAKKILRWHELAPSRNSEHIRSFEDTPILLTCACYWADSLPLAAISAVFLLSGPLCQPFIYGHESRTQRTCIWHTEEVGHDHVHVKMGVSQYKFPRVTKVHEIGGSSLVCLLTSLKDNDAARYPCVHSIEWE